MADDIVTRLRQKEGKFRSVTGVNESVVIDTLWAEAADEIERLRAENRELQSEVHRLEKLATYGK